MDIRKLIAFGKGGYVISLPKGWVRENHLSKGSFVSVDHESQRLVISPENEAYEEKPESEHVIDVDTLDEASLRRLLIGAYLDSYDLVVLKGAKLKDLIKFVKEEVQKLIAFEIIESSKDRVIIKDFLDINSISVDHNLRKMDIIVRSVLVEMKVDTPDDVYQSLLLRIQDIGRHYFVIIKAANRCLKDPRILGKLGVTQQQMHRFLSLAYTIKQISKKLTRVLKLLEICDCGEQVKAVIYEAVHDAGEHYLGIMRAVHKQDQDLALKLRAERNVVFERLDELEQRLETQKGTSACIETIRWMIDDMHEMTMML